MGSEITLADRINLDTPENIVKAEKTLWGLGDLFRALSFSSSKSKLISEVQSKLTDFMRKYSDAVGKKVAINTLTRKGYFENETQVEGIVCGNYDRVPTDQILQINGVYVIGFVGLIGSGKSTAGRILQEEYGSRHYPFIDGLHAFAYAMGVDPTQLDREGLRKINDVIKPQFGNDRFAKTVLHAARKQLKYSPLNMVSCDGLRSEQEGRLVLSQPNSNLFIIETGLEQRYSRAKNNPLPKKRPENYERFKFDSDFEEKNMMKPVFKLVTEPPFDNNDNEDNLRQQIRERFKAS